jgi:hypothetical protein
MAKSIEPKVITYVIQMAESGIYCNRFHKKIVQEIKGHYVKKNAQYFFFHTYTALQWIDKYTGELLDVSDLESVYALVINEKNKNMKLIPGNFYSIKSNQINLIK